MKKQLRTNFALKALAAVLATVCLAGGFLTSLFTLGGWDELWNNDASYYDSSEYYYALRSYRKNVYSMAQLTQREKWGETLTYLEQQELEQLKTTLSAENTNFRIRLLDNSTGELLYSNIRGPDTSKEAFSNAVAMVHTDTLTIRQGDILANYDYTDRNGWDDLPSVHIFTSLESPEMMVTPEDEETAELYGWSYRPYSEDWSYDMEKDSRVQSVSFALEYGVAEPMTVEDRFFEGVRDYNEYTKKLSPAIAVVALVLDALAVALVIFLCLGAGQRAGESEAVCNWFDRIPSDIMAVGLVIVFGVLFSMGEYFTLGYTLTDYFNFDAKLVFGLSAVALSISGSCLATLLTFVTRCKTRTLFRNTICWKAAAWCWKYLRKLGNWWAVTFGNWSMTRRVVLIFFLYLLGTVLSTLTIVLIPFYQGAVLYLLCRWVAEWRRIREGTADIVGGAPDTVIDTAKMKHFPDLAEHADRLNDLGGAINAAVDARMRSERMKAELITNVSHDLKTPLTSIINYVDLLKKEDIQEEKAKEYIEVLDRKSQRLKKLTEDLVEASKASTGTLPVNAERLGVKQLVEQALGEYAEKLSAAQLSPIVTMPEEELYVHADGRHFWRILDNLMGNCVKYAMRGTRVYLDVTAWDGWVTLSLKNVSAQQLNIPADQLMERFVRGDEARTTEGSGLGLSIARSLTDLQGGKFRLDVDGDLFKAVVSFPQVK